MITKKITEVQNFTNGDLGTIIQVQGDEIGQTNVSTLKQDITNSVVSELTGTGGVSLNLVNMKGVVPTYADLASLTPILNDAYQVEADGLVYVYTDTGFQADGEGFAVQPEPIGVVEEGNTQAVSGGEVYDSLKPTQELNDRQNLQNVNYFNKIGYYLSKNHGNEGVASNRKCTPFLFINPLEDIIVTGYDGADTDNTSLCNFYDSNKVFLGAFTTGETVGQKNNVLISKDFISANYPTAIFIRCSASTAQLNASVYGITSTKTLEYVDSKFSNKAALDLLLQDTITDSTESVTVTDGRVTRIINRTIEETPTIIRQIDYTYNENEIIEIRQLNQPYIKIQKKTNLITLNTEVSWL